MHNYTRNMCLSLTRVETCLITKSRRCPADAQATAERRPAAAAAVAVAVEADPCSQRCVGRHTLAAAHRCSRTPASTSTREAEATRAQPAAVGGASSGLWHPARLRGISTPLVSPRDSRVPEAASRLFCRLPTGGRGPAPSPPLAPPRDARSGDLVGLYL